MKKLIIYAISVTRIVSMDPLNGKMLGLDSFGIYCQANPISKVHPLPTFRPRLTFIKLLTQS